MLVLTGINSYSRRVQRLALQLPGGVQVLLRDLRLKLGHLRLCDLHAVQRADDLDVAFCRGLKYVKEPKSGADCSV